MRSLRVFNQVSLDGYFADRNGDMRWAHQEDDEWRSFVASNAAQSGVLVFGRVTYDLMAGYWPSPGARTANPAVAEHMNRRQKIVFSRTLKEPSWTPTRVLSGDLSAQVRELKREPGPDLIVLGSGTVVAQLTDARLVDEYRVVVIPLVLGGGRTMFEGVGREVKLALRSTRSFRNGNVLLSYELAPEAAG